MRFTPPSWLTPECCPGIWTELSSLPLCSEISVDSDGIVCVRTPSRPDFWSGNYLLFDPQYGPDFYTRLRAAWLANFGSVGRLMRVCYTTELPTGSQSPWLAVVPAGLVPEHLQVLALASFSPRQTKADFAYRIAPVQDAVSFERVVEAAEDMDFSDGGSAPWDFTVWRMREYWRTVSARTGAAWWAAWDGQDVVAYAGLFEEAGMVSIQEVGTCIGYRRQGIAGRLCSAMLASTQARQGVRRYIQVAEPGGAGERVYLRLGFKPVSTLYSMVSALF